jgi:Ni/Fe-hydrogenase subunit HybB-like protein
MLFYRFYVRGSLRQDESKDPAFTVRARRLAPPFMVVFFFSVTILAFDWISGLEPEWYSDMFGVYLFSGTFISGIAAMLLGVLSLMRRGRLPGVESKHVYNLGSLGLAFTVFFAYIGFAQYMLIWYANLPEEVIWFKHRTGGAWQPVALALPLLHFFIPFFLLIGSVGKKHPAFLRLAALSILLGHFVDLYWLIFPVLGLKPLFGWPELAMACFFLGLGFLQIRRAMGRGADMPVGDPLLLKGLEWQP